ncbi:MAG TPA: DUF192 domain-containing protein [bacterium]|nr:DUF192 domain-containing protein [bacterium]
MDKRMVLAVVLAASTALFAACEKARVGDEAAVEGAPAAESAVDVAGSTAGTAAATITITPEGGAPIDFTVMVAETDAQKAQGLKKVESLPKGHGMWFVFPNEGIYEFWMKDTVIPLDWVYISEGKKVVDVKRNNQPCAADAVCPPYAPSTPHKYVLEVNAGEAAAINPGDAVEVSIGPAN